MKKFNMIMVAVAAILALLIAGGVVVEIISALGWWPEGWRF